jgi:hypothetical protein
MFRSHLTSLNALALSVKQSREAAKKKKYATTFDTKTAALLNSNENIALMELLKEKALYAKVKKADLFKYCQEHNLFTADLQPSKILAPALKELVMKHLDLKLDELTKKSVALQNKYMPEELKSVFSGSPNDEENESEGEMETADAEDIGE